MKKARLILVGLVAVTVPAALFLWLSSNSDRTAPTSTSTPVYVGRESCVECHLEQTKLWQGSHHDLAMQLANDATVLGDFSGAKFTYGEVTSTFYQRGGRYYVRTDGPDGRLHDYPVAYTFGVEPLQQYLIQFPRGRYQALSVAWDARPAVQGGQRWFHLYPEEAIDHRDILHWTGPFQNWNHQCAECHSTNLRKSYDLAQDRFETTFSEIDVSCEACHGPASHHLSWARAAAGGEISDRQTGNGLLVHLTKENADAWSFEGAATAQRRQPGAFSPEIEMCGRCHSRRVQLQDYRPGEPLADSYQVALLDEGLYYPDGQILDEVYVYGSFLQSRMHQQGVTCQNCHDSHSGKLLFAGNELCNQCHLANTFDTPQHHFHESGQGSNCVDCHMPARNYMVVDPRRDHSFRVPRPDLSLQLGTPNACNGCHADRTVEWAADTVAHWYGSARLSRPHYGYALHAGRVGQVDAERQLIAVAENQEVPAIARATAFSLLGRYLSPLSLSVLPRGLRDDDPLVRLAALRSLEGTSTRRRASLGMPLLNDPAGSVRQEAARLLADLPANLTTSNQRRRLEAALTEYQSAQMFNADRAESHLNLALIHTRRGELKEAETEYEVALRLLPTFVSAYVNLADLYRLQDRDAEGEPLLRRALEIEPDNGDIHHALGLLLVRLRCSDQAVASLARAFLLRPDLPRYGYVYGVALHSTGNTGQALDILLTSHQKHPANRDLIYALATINRDAGRLGEARRFARKLVDLAPQDVTARRLLDSLSLP